MKAIFGPAGNSASFKKLKLSLSAYLNNFGLKAYEYQCGMGVRVSNEKAVEFGSSMSEITVSIHAPYYISLSSVEEQKRLKSVDYILQTARVAKAMGADRIVVHSGSCRKLEREFALDLAKKTLKLAVDALKNEHLDNIIICPETMGKVNQLGDLNEVLSLCRVACNLMPCVDFGHLNARTFGGIKTRFDYEKILDSIENELGFYSLKHMHVHFSKIEFSEKGGEKKHLTFSDEIFGPNFEPLAELVAKKNLSPIFICESAGTQAEDASTMKKIYENYL